MRRIVATVVLSVGALLTGLVGFTLPASAVVPGAPFTDTGCDGYSDAVARLYVASFGRAADKDGFNYWLDLYATAELSLQEMADLFIASAEFQERFGAIDDEAFVGQMYLNVLGRAEDPDGAAYWLELLTNGLTRSDLLVFFTESPENITRSGTEPPALGPFNTGNTEPFECDGADRIELCDAFLFLIFSGETIDLAVALGDDAPSGLLDAIDVLDDPDADFADQLVAYESLEGYVGPVCRDRWDRDLTPAPSNTAAVGTFFAAVVTGDEAAAEAIAPDDVRAQFGAIWISVPDDPQLGPPSFAYDGGETFSMQLAPSVSVGCTVADGVVTSCAFGE